MISSRFQKPTGRRKNNDNMVLFMWDQQVTDPNGSMYPANRFELMRFKDEKPP